MRRVLIVTNLLLLVLFPLAWQAPLMRAGILPLFGLSEISILSGIATLWQEGEAALAALVALFALGMPIAKTVALALYHIGHLPARLLPAVQTLGKLAMADVFLIALYIILAKGAAVGRVESAWGLWLFTVCVLTSFAIGLTSQRVFRREDDGRQAA